MKTIKNYKFVILSALFALVLTSCHHIGVNINSSNGGVLKDAVLFVSDENGNPKSTYALGDIDLSDTLTTFQHTVDTTTANHWWLIGSLDGDVVYSSVVSLQGVDMYSVEPYDGVDPELDWNIPNNLMGYVNETDYSLDWYAQTIRNHSSHSAANKTEVTLWRFNKGNKLGTIKINLRRD